MIEQAKSVIETKDLILGIGIFATLFVGIFNATTNWRISRRTIFINTVTAERVKWLSALRENISTYCGLTYTWQLSRFGDKSREQETIIQIDKLRHLIRLQLNPGDSPDSMIETLVDDIAKLVVGHQVDTITSNAELNGKINLLVVHSQNLLKNEWEKVKKETKQGDLKEREHCLAFIFKWLHDKCFDVTDKWRKQVNGK